MDRLAQTRSKKDIIALLHEYLVTDPEYGHHIVMVGGITMSEPIARINSMLEEFFRPGSRQREGAHYEIPKELGLAHHCYAIVGWRGYHSALDEKMWGSI